MIQMQPMSEELWLSAQGVIRRMHELSPIYSAVPFDPEVVKEYYDACIHRSDVAFGRLLVGDHGSVLGFVAGALVPMMFSRRVIAADWGLFVLDGIPDRARWALRLIRSFKEWAREKDAAMLWMGVTVGIADEGAGALLRHAGFKRAGAYYVMRNV